MKKYIKNELKCIECEFFKERTFFPHTGGTSGKCHNPKSPNYNKWTLGFWGCTPKKYIITQGELFNY